MKGKKILAFVLVLALVCVQFAMLGVVYAAGSALTGRSDFVKGIHVNPSSIAGDRYAKTYDAVLNAEALGVNLIRSKLTNRTDGYRYGNEYDVGFADLAAEHGMNMMFVAPFPYKDSDGNFLTADTIDIDYIADVYTEAATNLKGKVAYYQIDNELNAIAIQKDESGNQRYNGMKASNFDQAQINAFAVGIYAVNKAIKAVDSNAKTIVNISWIHSGFIEALLNVDIDTDTGRIATDSSTNTAKLDFDMIGLDWYSDYDHHVLTGTNEIITGEDFIEILHEKFPSKDIIICEADIRPKAYDDSYEVVYWDDADWIDTFARYCYSKDYVKGFCSFQLYDQPQFETDQVTGEWTGVFNRESHHGLIDDNNNKKATYYVVQNLFGGTGEIADRTVTAAPGLSNEGVLNSVFQTATAETVFPRVYSDLEVLKAENKATVDFSNGNYIEFDLYVEDAAAFKSAMSNLGLYLHMFLYSDDNIQRNCRYIPIEYVVADGWNHFKISKAAFDDHSETDVDWTAINKAVLKFSGSDISRYSEISGMKFAVANICSTSITAPANVVNDGKIVIDEEGFSGTIGKVAGNFPGYYGRGCNNGVFETTLDISACQKIEFDLYVENLEIFRKVNAANHDGKGLVLRLISDASGQKHRRFYLPQYVTKQGWNHIVIPISEYDANTSFDTSKLYMYHLRFNQSSTQTNPLGDPNYPAMYVAFKNFNGIMADYYTSPDLPENRVVTTTNRKIGTLSTNTMNITNITTEFETPLDLSTSEYIEFDFYVENVEHFWTYQTAWQNSSSGGHGFCFYLSPDSTAPTNSSGISFIRASANKRIFLYFNDPDNQTSILRQQITQDGWNHIKIPISEWKTGDDQSPSFGTPVTDLSYFSSIKRVGMFTARANHNSATNVFAGEHIGFANLCGTGEEYSIIPELPKNIVAANTESVVRTFEDGHAGIRKIAKNLANYPLDLSSAEQVEFDLYVEDVEHFFDYQESIMNSPNHYFCIFLSSERKGGSDQDYITNADNRVYYRFADLKDQITNNGWNHIVTNITDWNKGATGKATKADFSDIGRIGFFTTRASIGEGNEEHLYSDEHFGFANVCGTVDLTVPDCEVTNKTDFIGAVLKPVRFDSEGTFAADLSEAVDISDTAIVAIDVFIGGNDISGITVELGDANGGYALYDFEGLTAGWNHLEATVASGVDDDGEPAEIDLTAINNYALYGEPDENIFVSNFYATSEIVCTNHIAGDWIIDTPATVESVGHRHKECTICGRVLEEEDIDKLPAYVPGDITGDRVVNNKDITRLFKYLSGWNVEVNRLALDINGDGKVNNKDLLRLFKYLSGWQVDIF